MLYNDHNFDVQEINFLNCFLLAFLFYQEYQVHRFVCAANSTLSL
jgi:hypothetical protein